MVALGGVIRLCLSSSPQGANGNKSFYLPTMC
jgi:hypothetical protein